MLFNVQSASLVGDAFYENWTGIVNTWHYLCQMVDEFWSIITQGFTSIGHMLGVAIESLGIGTALTGIIPTTILMFVNLVVAYCVIRLILTFGGSGGS